MSSDHDRVACVHAQSFGQDAEFRFPGGRYLVEGGALRVLGADGSDAMAFGVGVWTAAWIENPSGSIAGLSPRASAAPLPAPHPQGSPTPAAEAKAARSAIARRAGAALSGAPYKGLAALALAIDEDQAAVERALTDALQQQTLSYEALTLPRSQLALDAALPEIIERDRPKSLREMMDLLRARLDGADCDYVQLRIWLKQNPNARAQAAA